MRVIINPIGISPLYKIITFQATEKIPDTIDKKEIQNIKKQILEKYYESDLTLIDLSAETNSISRMIEQEIINTQDIIYLLYSSTTKGKISALVIEDILINKMEFKASNIFLKKLEDIKVKDAKAFIAGASKLNDLLYEEILKHYNKKEVEIFINITGGFKVLTPALTMFYLFLVKSGYKAELCYLYEKSTQIIQFKIAGDRILPQNPSNEKSTLNEEI